MSYKKAILIGAALTLLFLSGCDLDPDVRAIRQHVYDREYNECMYRNRALAKPDVTAEEWDAEHFWCRDRAKALAAEAALYAKGAAR